VKLLTAAEYQATAGDPMTPIEEQKPVPSDFWEYFDAIPPEDLAGVDAGSGQIALAYEEPSGCFDHVLLATGDPAVFVVIVVDTAGPTIYGHHLLDLR
jgi:hypothetical protein